MVLLIIVMVYVGIRVKFAVTVISLFTVNEAEAEEVPLIDPLPVNVHLLNVYPEGIIALIGYGPLPITVTVVLLDVLPFAVILLLIIVTRYIGV